MSAPARLSFDDLYEAHKADVYALALRYGAGDRAFAEDITQDVFLQLMVSIDKGLEEREGLGGWLYRVTTNRCLNHLRKTSFRRRVRRFFVVHEPRPAPQDLERRTGDREQATAIFALLDALPAKERVAFCAYHLDERSQQEIGELIGHSKSYVCKLIQRAEAHLRRELPQGAVAGVWRTEP